MNSVLRKTAAVFTAAAITLTGLSVNAFADSEKLISETVTAEYAASVSKPTYTIKGSKGVRRIRLRTSTSGATIYYTTDGSTPTTGSKKYTGLIKITKTTVIRAIAVKSGSKSAVMKKTVKIGTKLGDVTGDGTISATDYNRLKNCLAGSTSYICTDNADVDGNKKVNKTDLNLIRQYLNGDIDEFPAQDEVENLSKPEITVYRVYGGKKFKIESEEDATIYYTTNGKTPTNKSTKYTGTFIVDEDTTVKAVAYADGEYSDVKTRSITVDDCALPTSNRDTSKEYEESVEVSLSCATSGSRIYYTTDGTDPVRNGTRYLGPIELTENTTLKFYSEAKGYANSKVVTLNYKVKSSNYMLSGIVWNDTPNSNSVSDGIRSYGEQGINGITVMLLNASTNNYEETTVTSTINGVPGSYILTKAKPGNRYKVVFQFNGQKYRAYDRIVTGGNQAVTSDALPLITVKSNGAYISANNTRLTSANNYNSAIVDGVFNKTYATTSSAYTAAASNINLALESNIYGGLQLSFGAARKISATTGVTSGLVSGEKVYSNDTIIYSLTVVNDSPQDLRSALLNFYINENLSLYDIDSQNSSDSITYSYIGTAGNGYSKYQVSCPSLVAGEAVTYTITAKVNPALASGVGIANYAEVSEYTYTSSCYDKNSIPGNFNFTVREKDEAQTNALYGYSDVTAAQTLVWSKTNDFTTPITAGANRPYYFSVTNGTGDVNELYINCNNGNISYQIFRDTSNSNGYVLLVTGVTAGTSSVQISLKRDASKNLRFNVTIT